MPRTNTADIAPEFTYEWNSAEQVVLKRTDGDGKVVWIPADPRNTDYAAYLASGEEAASYVPPEPPPEKTTEQKVDQLLADYGLSRAELRATLEAN